MGLHKLAAGAVGAAALAIGAAASAHPPYGLVADPAGNVYFSDLETVWRLAPDGGLTVFRPGTEGVHVHEVGLARDGAVTGDQVRYEPAGERYYAGLWRRPPGGRESWVIAPTTAPPKGAGMAEDSSGARYVALWVSNQDRRTMLFRRSRDGRVDLLMGPRDAAGRFRQPTLSSVGGMAFAGDGALIFADGRFLRRFAGRGGVTTLFEAPAGAELRGIAAAPDGRILAADAHGRTVTAVGGAAGATMIYRSPTGWFPTAVALPSGRLLVLEANADPYDYVNRVRVVEIRQGRGEVVALPAKGPTAAAPATAAPAPGAGVGLALPAVLAAAAVLLAAALVLHRRRMG